jgi:hypothetical protein
VSDKLDEARQLFAAQQYKQALDVLWDVHGQARTDLEDARGVLRLASAIREATSGRQNTRCLVLTHWAQKAADRLENDLDDVGTDHIAMLESCRVLGGDGLPPEVGQYWDLIFNPDRLFILDGSHRNLCVPYDEVVALEIGGPGERREGGGFIGGGFGLEGAVVGMLVATGLNLLTSRKKTDTVVCLKTTTAELFLHTQDITPDDLRMRLSGVFNVLRRQQASRTGSAQPRSALGDIDAVERLAKLAGLLEAKLITRDEFDKLKADLLQPR